MIPPSPRLPRPLRPQPGPPMSPRPSARRFAPVRPSTKRAGRSGVTLTEVLMSLLVMGIGVTSVATLFPLAVLRGARATQLTAGTVLKENAEETVRFSRSPALTAPLPVSVGGVPIGPPGQVPAGGVEVTAFSQQLGDSDGDPGVNSRAMLLDPDANGWDHLVGPVAGGGQAWGPGLATFVPADLAGRDYFVDPLGAALAAGDGNPVTSSYGYGATGTDGKGILVDQFNNPLGRPPLRFAWPFPWEVINAAETGNSAVQQRMIETAYEIVGRAGDYGTDLDTEAIVTRRDTPHPHLEVAFPGGEVQNGSLEEFFPQTDAGGNPSDDVPGVGLASARAIVFAFRDTLAGTPQQVSVAIPLSRLRSQTAIDVVPTNGRVVRLALPRADFLANAGLGAVGDQARLRVRVERPDRKYSWLLTNSTGGYDTTASRAQVAVFFNRAFSAEDESTWQCVYRRNPGGPASYVLFWDSATQKPPAAQGGGWLLNMRDLGWLKVGRVLVDEGDAADVAALFPGGSPPASAKYLEFLLSSETPRVSESGGTRSLFAAFPRGVVDVYALDL